VYSQREDTYAVQLIWPRKNPATGWDKVVPLSKFDASEFEPRYREPFLCSCEVDLRVCIFCRAQRLLRLGVEAIETQHVLQDPMGQWFDPNGRAFVIGDAVHFLNPGTSHGAAMAMEDAAVVGSLFSRLRTRNRQEVLVLLNAYQEIREERCNLITDSEYEKIHFSILEVGDPIRDQRDAGLKASREMNALDWEDISEEYLKAQWEEFKGSFGYEAYDAADGWWVDWGSLRERMSGASFSQDLGVVQQKTNGTIIGPNINVVVTTTAH